MQGAGIARTGGSATSAPADRQSVRFSIPGEPAPKGSKNVSRSGHVYEQSKRLIEWRKTASEVLAGHPQLAPPYRVTVTFVCQRPKQPSYNWPARGDLDKFQRAVGDVLESTGVLVNDAHIIDWRAVKIYGREPRTYGVVETIEGY